MERNRVEYYSGKIIYSGDNVVSVAFEIWKMAH